MSRPMMPASQGADDVSEVDIDKLEQDNANMAEVIRFHRV